MSAPDTWNPRPQANLTTASRAAYHGGYSDAYHGYQFGSGQHGDFSDYRVGYSDGSADRFANHGFSQEDIWYEMRAIGGDERQAIRSLIEAESRLDDWLSKEDASAYGECKGAHLVALVHLGLARIGSAAAGCDTNYRPVSLTDAGFAALTPTQPP